MKSFHLAPSVISWSASTHPLITWFTPKIAGSPRLIELSNKVPSIKVRVFVYAPKEWRLEYAKTNPLVKAKDAKGIKEEVEKTDRNRSAYYNYYTQNRWGDAHNYDLAINAALGRETCVKMILDAAAAKEKTLG